MPPSQSAKTDASSLRASASPIQRLLHELPKLLLALHTLRHLRFRQWIYLIIRRVLPDRYQQPVIAVMPEMALPALRTCAISAVPHHCVNSDDRLYFLNEAAHFPVAAPDWSSTGKSRLWRYNLHYFEFLSDPSLSLQQRNALIDSWIISNPVGHGDGWEPYPVSLRIISWVRYFDYLLRNGVPVEAAWRRSLYLHCDWLFHHMEFHIDANHLLKNIVALFLGAQLLRGADDSQVQIWHKKSAKWLQVALREQFNRDGGHYERSPMYHLLCLHLCLDAYNALSKNQIDSALKKQLSEVIVKAFEFAFALQHGNGRLALFNDSANGIAPDLDTLRRYAESIDGYLQLPANVRYGSSWFAGSGYFCWHDARQHLVVSARSPGPSYQPGHSHADCLSYEYSLDGVPVIVNAGNTCYEFNEDRRYARSTSAHNTIEIDGHDQSELWSIFRMARRARVKVVAPQHTAQGVVLFAQHDGYTRLQSGLVHQREIVAMPAGIEIRDMLEGKGRHRIKQFTHIHPDYSVAGNVSKDNIYSIVDREKNVIVNVHLDSCWSEGQIRIDRALYFDQFGLRKLRDSIVITADVTLPCALQCRIEPVATSINTRH